MASVLQGYLVGYRSTASALLARIRELESRDYPTDLSRALLQALKGAIHASQEIVGALGGDDPDALENTVVRHGQLLAYIHRLVHLVSTSFGSDVPRWAIEPMKFEIKRYLKDSVDILIVGTDEGGNFAYDYRLDSLARVLTVALGAEAAKKLMVDLPEHMAVFHFPFGERDNVIAHGAFFHEVAHQIDIGIRGISGRVIGEFLTTKDTEIREKTRELSEPLLQQLLGGNKVDGQKTLEDEQRELLLESVVKVVQQVLVSWAREFCADLVATRILGPAYAVVIVISPSLLGNLRHHSSSHPATLLRLKVVLDLLADGKAGDFFTDSGNALATAGIKDLLEDWKRRCDAAAFGEMKWYQQLNLATPELHGEIVGWGIELGATMAREVVKETTEQQYYNPSRYREDITNVLPILEQWITINERIDYTSRKHTPNEVATIYNVGVACYLKEESPEGRDRLNHLLRKSIELSQIQRVLLN